MKRFTLLLLILAAAAAVWWWRGQGTDGWRIANSPPPRSGIVCFGDSLTTGYGVTPDQAYPAHLAEILGLSRSVVIARGVNGRTLAQARGHVARDVLASSAGTAIVLLGGNDQLQARSAEDAMDDLDAIVREIVASGRMVVVCDFSPIPAIHGGWARGSAEIAQRHGAILVEGAVDGLYGDDDHTSADNIHLNASGQRILAERIAAALGPHL
jgi:acyl-CoA thioesterase-1